MSKVILIIMAFTTLAAYPQKQTNIWYFGQNAGVNFNSETPVALLDGELFTVEGSSCIADTNGNLLFYTNGVTVWNKEHSVMDNGTDLMGSETSAQSALIAPKPGFGNTYYIFTVNYQGTGGLTYSEVDMDANGGLGRITEVKNVLLVPFTTEQISGVAHQNGNDLWIITHGYGNNAIYSFLITPDGVNTVPVVSNTGLSIPMNTDNDGRGYIKISPDGTRIVSATEESGVQLFDFNDATGIASNGMTIKEGSGYYGAEFSPSGNVVYITNEWIGGIEQLNLQADNITASAIFVVPVNGYGENAIQLGPNGKIYFSSNDGNSLAVINSPNIVGLGCDVQFDAISLGGRTAWIGLPNFIQSYFNPAIFAEDLCFGSSTKFVAGPGPAPQTAVWDFGDGSVSQLGSPEHIYEAPGTYTVTVTAMVMGSLKTITKEIVIIETLQFILEQPAAGCTTAGMNITAQPLNFEAAQAIFRWEFNGQAVSTAPTLQPQEFGTYSLTVTANGCTATQSITIQQQTLAVMFSEGCKDYRYTLEALPENGSFNAAAAIYSWAGPNSFNSSNPQVIIETPGQYIVTLTTDEGCFASHVFDVTDTECPDPFIPKGISPNGDGKNDVFDLSLHEVAKLEVFNRYGLEVFSKAQYVAEWYGQSNDGNKLPDGTYYYYIEKITGKIITGWVYVNR